MNSTEQHHHTKRDADTLKVLGIFILVLAVPVLIGTFWAENLPEVVINVMAGCALLIVGGGFIFRAWWTLRHLD